MSKRAPEFIDAAALAGAILGRGLQPQLITIEQAAAVALDAGLVPDGLREMAFRRFLASDVRKALNFDTGSNPDQLSMFIHTVSEVTEEDGTVTKVQGWRHVNDASEKEWLSHLDELKSGVHANMLKANARTRQYNRIAQARGWRTRRPPFPGIS